MNESELGAIGELLTAAELLRRGFYVAKPVVDVNGYDLLAGNSHNQYNRLQIKTSRQPIPHGSPEKAIYIFHSRARKDSDFFILCCLFHRNFYVIPTEKMPSGVRLSGDGSGGSKFEKYLSAFNLLSNGLSNEVVETDQPLFCKKK